MLLDNVLNTLRRFVGRRFEALRWPLSSLSDRVAATRSDGIINRRAAGKRFPIRAVRYWWVRCALLQEMRNRNAETVIADAGCSRGNIKRFVGEIPSTRWVGLDWHIDDAVLSECGYSRTYQCDFDEPLPLPERSVDVIVFLHVIEHLPRPEFTVSEFSRVLRPGGLLLAGSPVAPALIARVRERQLRARMKKGKSKPGGHINSMDCERWKSLFGHSGMDVEMLTGTFFARWSGSPLENRAWWVRLNQLWGGVFPPLGGEVYLAGRKPLLPGPDRIPCAAGTSNTLRRRIARGALGMACITLGLALPPLPSPLRLLVVILGIALSARPSMALLGRLLEEKRGATHLRKLGKTVARIVRACPSIAAGCVRAWKLAWVRMCTVLLLGLGLWGSWLSLTTEACPVQKLAEEHQDGNDKFYVLTHPSIGGLNINPKIEKLQSYKAIVPEQKEDESKGIDAHFLLHVDSMKVMKASISQSGLYIVDQTSINDHVFYLFSSENGDERPN